MEQKQIHVEGLFHVDMTKSKYFQDNHVDL